MNPIKTGNTDTINRSKKLKSPLPMRHGVSASRVWLPSTTEGNWETMIDFLQQRFPFISKHRLLERMSRGDIVDAEGNAIQESSRYRGETFLFYYREIANEAEIPFRERILYKNDNILVVDKPHFIPVTPTGRFVRESLLARLKHQFQIEQISPVHRLDRETAGIVMFTCNINARRVYQMLFQNHKIDKTYEAIAPFSERSFPLIHRSRMIKSEPFFLMQEVKGEANTETEIYLLEKRGKLAKYALKPTTGKQHQLRVHMMSLGVPILNDSFYPQLTPYNKEDDYTTPLQLLARSIKFNDPISGEQRFFESKRNLLF